MRIVVFCAVLGIASWSAFAGSGAAARVGVYTEFEQQPPASLQNVLKEELLALLAPFGFDPEWRDISTAGREVWVDLAFVRFRGRCDVGAEVTAQDWPIALGWTAVSDGEVQPFTFVDCGRILAFVRNGLSRVRADKRESVFQRAVARVLAHELYHILANTRGHAASGVGSADFTVVQLLSDDFRFEGRPAQRLRLKGAQALLQAAIPGR
jgi:hypothetical protein